ncbi:MAG TPA: DUF6036 family nucleotidyltransferase [Ktedonobacteraceae bacterium]
MNKEELESLLEELDEALVEAFPGPEPMRVLVVGGACLVFTEVTTRQTKDVDVIIFDLLGTGEASLVYNLNPMTAKLRRLIGAIGKRHGLRGDDRMFLNDDCASFLLELGQGTIPETQLFRAYRKLHLYVPVDLRYILACKFMAGRPDKDFDDISILREKLEIHTGPQARALVTQFFPDPYLQQLYELSKTLAILFPEG